VHGVPGATGGLGAAAVVVAACGHCSTHTRSDVKVGGRSSHGVVSLQLDKACSHTTLDMSVGSTDDHALKARQLVTLVHTRLLVMVGGRL